MNCLDKERERLNKEIENLWLLEPAATVAQTVADLVDGSEVTVIRWPASKPFVSIMLRELKNWKEAIPVLQNLAQAGWHTDKENVYSDYAEIDRRTYNLLGPNEVPNQMKELRDYSLRVMCFLANEGATCKRVQVGTKEEPVYEYQCQ